MIKHGKMPTSVTHKTRIIKYVYEHVNNFE